MKEQLQYLRKQKGLTQKEAAEKFGVKLTTYQKYELDVIAPSYETLIKIAQYYGVTTDYLLGIEPAPDPISQLTQEEMEQKLVESYFKLPPELRKKFLDGLRQTVMECCPDYVPEPEPKPEPEQKPDNLIIDDVKKDWQGRDTVPK